MTREEIFHTKLAEHGEVGRPAFTRNIEVLVRLVGGVEKPGMMLEDDNMPSFTIARTVEFGSQPGLLRAEVIGGLLRRMNDDRVKHKADESAVAEAIMVGAEPVGVSLDCFWAGNVFNVVVPHDIVDRDVAIDLC